MPAQPSRLTADIAAVRPDDAAVLVMLAGAFHGEGGGTLAGAGRRPCGGLSDYYARLQRGIRRAGWVHRRPVSGAGGTWRGIGTEPAGVRTGRGGAVGGTDTASGGRSGERARDAAVPSGWFRGDGTTADAA